MVPFSILDLSQVGEGNSVADAFANTARMARQAEELGYNRYWLAEHHGMPGVASSATAVAIGHVGHHTSKIRIGSGGIMLPNHAPLIIAEQFGTLEALFPGRVDLGLGRAPGTDMRTARALRRNMENGVDSFPYDVAELQAYMEPPNGTEPILAVPGSGAKVPIWVLGSSTYGAQLAAQMGLPYAFASHFAPDLLHQALRIYRQQYRPSPQNPEPKVMVGVMGVAADTDEEAKYLFTSMQQAFAALRRNERKPFPAPVRGLQLSPEERQMVDHMLQYAVVGSSETINRTLETFLAATGADELIVSMPIHDVEARLRSVEIFSRSPSMQKV
ncbi:LLM class flavin-dependent oxidoreductase [Asticcacaulis sp. AND118]|uniref:LLM class flavin-dependent oxidoreductase n=1 Tax=Asticcacaulis sp. AND118 TaxID=2840468 RepID=UPI001CFFD28A|nr:LLM class flavin-dependent oxidoreductase [Asticcacaulis sp. AND118]UDF04603.1 LLM class flavin-dependent oxidoreductase [Asticcacaulis sp. AND118]